MKRLCSCGHERELHRHWRSGTNCALCDCSEYRWRWRTIVLLSVAVLTLTFCGVKTAGATPPPVRATKIVVAHRATITQPPPLSLATLEGYLAHVVGVPVRISCDTPGVPSPLDGNTLDFATADGQVFYSTPSVIGNVLHVSVLECQQAQSANRHRDRAPATWSEFHGRRIDLMSGLPLLILLHEAFHVSENSPDEGRVECDAVSNAWPLVEQFSLPSWEASMMLAGMQARHAAWPLTDPRRAVC